MMQLDYKNNACYKCRYCNMSYQKRMITGYCIYYKRNIDMPYTTTDCKYYSRRSKQ